MEDEYEEIQPFAFIEVENFSDSEPEIHTIIKTEPQEMKGSIVHAKRIQTTTLKEKDPLALDEYENNEMDLWTEQEYSKRLDSSENYQHLNKCYTNNTNNCAEQLKTEIGIEFEEIGNECSNIPFKILEQTRAAPLSLLQEKSQAKYDRSYVLFNLWCKRNSFHKISERALMTYFYEKAKIMSPNTLWSIYSMLKSTIILNKNVNIGVYKNLTTFLKRQSIGYRSKQSSTLSKAQIKTFLLEAPDEKHLLRKVVLVFGISGACRRHELTHLNVGDVEDKDSLLVVKIPGKQNYKSRVFTVINDDEGSVDYLSIYRKYVKLRPPETPSQRFFLRYSNGKCMRQVMGMNNIGKVPKEIAEYLNLPEPDLYTGHCFRRSYASLQIDSTWANRRRLH